MERRYPKHVDSGRIDLHLSKDRSVHALYEAARARRRQLEERTIETGEFRTEAVDDDLAFRESSGRTANLTHWSFGQLATIAGAPPNYLRTLPASIASSAINYGMSRIERAQHQLFVADTAQVAPKHLFEACDKYLQAKEATANTTRVVEFERERLEVVRRYLGDMRLSSITRETIEGFQAKRRVDGASNRTVNMDVGALRRVLKRFKHWHRLEDDVKMPTESGGAPIGRALSDAEQERLFEVAKGNPEWTHVYCAAVLAANTSMRGVEIKHLRRLDIDRGANALHIRKSKNEGSKRILPLNEMALGAIKMMIERADELGHKDLDHYLWCANQHHTFDPTKPGRKWDTAWRALRDAAGLRGLRFHDLRHTVVTRLLEAGEPDHVVESITGHLSRRMLEHYSHIRLTAKKAALDRLNEPRKARK